MEVSKVRKKRNEYVVYLRCRKRRCKKNGRCRKCFDFFFVQRGLVIRSQKVTALRSSHLFALRSSHLFCTKVKSFFFQDKSCLFLDEDFASCLVIKFFSTKPSFKYRPLYFLKKTSLT